MMPRCNASSTLATCHHTFSQKESSACLTTRWVRTAPKSLTRLRLHPLPEGSRLAAWVRVEGGSFRIRKECVGTIRACWSRAWSMITDVDGRGPRVEGRGSRRITNNHKRMRKPATISNSKIEHGAPRYHAEKLGHSPICGQRPQCSIFQSLSRKQSYWYSLEDVVYRPTTLLDLRRE